MVKCRQLLPGEFFAGRGSLIFLAACFVYCLVLLFVGSQHYAAPGFLEQFYHKQSPQPPHPETPAGGLVQQPTQAPGRDVDGAPKATAMKLLEPIEVSVFYETECPGSHQLVGAITESKTGAMAVFRQADDFVNWHFVPFGKSLNQTSGRNSDALLFDASQCQHGVSECLFNLLHACAISFEPQTQAQEARALKCFLEQHSLASGGGTWSGEVGVMHQGNAFRAQSQVKQTLDACVVSSGVSPELAQHIRTCTGWQSDLGPQLDWTNLPQASKSLLVDLRSTSQAVALANVPKLTLNNQCQEDTHVCDGHDSANGGDYTPQMLQNAICAAVNRQITSKGVLPPSELEQLCSQTSADWGAEIKCALRPCLP